MYSATVSGTDRGRPCNPMAPRGSGMWLSLQRRPMGESRPQVQAKARLSQTEAELSDGSHNPGRGLNSSTEDFSPHGQQHGAQVRTSNLQRAVHAR